MTNRLLIILLCTCSLAGSIAHAQQPDTTRSEVSDDLERALENFDPEESDFNTEQFTQFLQDLAANPVNVNAAQIDELMQVPGINLKTGRAILGYRRNVKPFESISELEEVPGIGRVTLERVRPYVTIGSSELRYLYTDPKYWTSDGEFEAFTRYQRSLQEEEGFTRPDSSGFLGRPFKYYQRLRYRSNHISANITQEKDAGEPLEGPTGFDYNSWHFALTDNGKLQQFIVGDYNLSFGQGLVMWNGGAFGKGRDVIGSSAKNERGIKPYTSAMEANYFRGVAATVGDKFQFTGFYSAQSRSASRVNKDTTRFPSDGGMHRTLNEIAKKDNVNQAMYGGRIRARLPFGLIGASGYYTSFDQHIYAGSALYQKYDFRGSNTSALGIDYNFLVGTTLLYGEVARTQNGGYGLVAGVESPLGNDTELVLTYRNYQKDFQSVYGSGFGESSGEPQNEQGIYMGLRHELNSKILLSAYFDQYRFPAPRFGTHQPTQGYDWLGLVEVDLDSKMEFYLQARSEIEDSEYDVTDSYGRTQRKLGKAARSSLRAQFQYWVNPQIRMRTRGEIVRSAQPGASAEQGFLFYQDLRYEPNSKWTFDTRITVFHTDSYDSRVYQFENDLLYVFSNSVLYDQGQRLYILANFEPWEFMEIWAKFGITIFENRQVLGSGLSQIEGNKRSDLGLQVRFVF
ncbi:helix-hairpin-helix domain-containing protein [Aliifodinibius sp. S!AR15-10]|uniref:ComEA family DNA-binding protein n=1 Tax=Aliifodinibius sp. S!AR15-10 TaxID=2950437 RepID=UPI0028549F48|nr:helix-hairpin-helix domain-containing protein [Aliifodinibius sp. S!AR15-10]MDR8393513.1 helix-hairpin-helix domain-containing protein [Aliifodinibius sp. S!AR15-10]